MCEDLKQIIKKQTLYLVCYLKKEQKLEYKTYNNHLSTFSFFRPFLKKKNFLIFLLLYEENIMKEWKRRNETKEKGNKEGGDMERQGYRRNTLIT